MPLSKTCRSFILAAISMVPIAPARADITAKMTLTISPATEASSATVQANVTIESTDPLPGHLIIKMNQPPGFLGIAEPLLDGPLTASLPDPDAPHNQWSSTAATPDPASWTWNITTKGAKSLRYAYRIPMTHRSIVPDPSRGDEMLPFISQSHGMLPSGLIVVLPVAPTPTRVLVRIDAPETLRFISPWPLATDHPEAADQWYEAPPNLGNSAEFMPLGPWTGPEFTIRSFKVRMLFAPDAPEMEQRLRKPLESIIDYAIQLFDQRMAEHCMMIFRPDPKASGASSATVGMNTMHFVLDNDMLAAEMRSCIHIMAHEFVHLWGRGTLAIAGVHDMRWLHEGFTDYYASQICARLGIADWSSFTTAITDRIISTRETPVRGRWSIAQAGNKGLEGDGPSNHLAYEGGWILACWLDAAIRTHAKATGRVTSFTPREGDVAKPGTLDEFMRDFYNDPAWSPTVRPTTRAFMDRLLKYLPADQVASFERWTQEPWAFNAEQELAAVGITTTRTQVTAQKLGVQLAPGTLQVKGFIDQSAAQQLGVEIDDEITAINSTPIAKSADMRQAWAASGDGETTITIHRAGKEVTLRGDKPKQTLTTIDASLLQ